MPVLSHSAPSNQRSRTSGRSLNIGLINNMADGALEATERQFVSLLNAASDGFSIHLSLYALPEVPRGESSTRHIRTFYSSFEKLLDTELDGLIVTGREPLTPNLADEPYWKSFTKVTDWARNNTCSTIWSCLAAHAAILHMDGVGRVRRDHKHCGVFDCARVSDHLLTAGMSSRFQLPHSRWNGIPEEQLTAYGYRVLTRTTAGDVDIFVKLDNKESMFVFFQGHPEYESKTLMLEYRRDVGRYFRGETDCYPVMPLGYFDSDMVALLSSFQAEALSRPGEDILAQVSRCLENANIENTWRATAACIYRNWLEYLYEQKQKQSKSGEVALESRGVARSTPLITDAMISPRPFLPR